MMKVTLVVAVMTVVVAEKVSAGTAFESFTMVTTSVGQNTESTTQSKAGSSDNMQTGTELLESTTTVSTMPANDVPAETTAVPDMSTNNVPVESTAVVPDMSTNNVPVESTAVVPVKSSSSVPVASVTSEIIKSTTVLSTVTTQKPTAESTHASSVGQFRGVIYDQLRFDLTMALNLQFSESLNQRFSSAYQELEQSVLNLLNNSFRDCPGHLHSTVKNFREGSVIVSFSVIFDPDQLIWSPSINVNQITDYVMTKSLETLKLSNDPPVDDSYIDSVTAAEVRNQSATMASYVSHPCVVPRVCLNPCYTCHETPTPSCSYKSTLCTDKNSACYPAENDQTTCDCKPNHEYFFGDCVHSLQVMRIVCGIVGACLFGVCSIIAALCTIDQIHRKGIKSLKMDQIEEQLLRQAAMTSVGVQNPGLDMSPEGVVSKQYPLHPVKSFESPIEQGVQLKISTLPRGSGHHVETGQNSEIKFSNQDAVISGDVISIHL